MYHTNPMEEERRALFRPTSSARDFIDIARQQAAQRRYNALGQRPSTERTGRPSSNRAPMLRIDGSLPSRQAAAWAVDFSHNAAAAARRSDSSPLKKKNDSFWILDAEHIFDKQARRHEYILKLFTVYRIEMLIWAQRPQLAGGGQSGDLSDAQFAWNRFKESMITTKLPSELHNLLGSPHVEEPDASLISNECRFGLEYEFQAFKPEWKRRCINESDKDDVLVSRNTLLLLLESVHWRVRLGSEEMGKCFKSDEISTRKALASAEEQAGPETDDQFMKEKSFSQRICQRIQYMDRFSAWAQSEGFQTAVQTFFNPEPDLDVDTFLFRTGILEQQYVRTKRQFYHKQDILCQMYGLGMHEITFVINNPNKCERKEQLEMMGLYHKLVCHLGFQSVEDITTQFAYLSYACRNLVKREIDPKLKKYSLQQLKEARRREFKITTLLVNNVWKSIYTKNESRPLRTFQHQSRRQDGREDIADWFHLTVSERRALFGNDTAAAERYVPEAFIQLDTAAPASVPALQIPTPVHEDQKNRTPDFQAANSRSSSIQMRRCHRQERRARTPCRQSPSPRSLSLADIGEVDYDKEVERCRERPQHRRVQDSFPTRGALTRQFISSSAVEHLKLWNPIRQPYDPTEDAVPTWRKREVHPIRQPIGPSPGRAPKWRQDLLLPIRQPNGPFSRMTPKWRQDSKPMERPEILCPKPVRTTSFKTCVAKLDKAVRDIENAQRGWIKMAQMVQNGLPLCLIKFIQEDPGVLAAMREPRASL